MWGDIHLVYEDGIASDNWLLHACEPDTSTSTLEEIVSTAEKMRYHEIPEDMLIEILNYETVDDYLNI
jgi:hypothetical protein